MMHQQPEQTDEKAFLSDALKEQITPISALLRSRFEDSKRDRKSVEERLLTDLRQYKGLYDPQVLAAIPKGRSRTYRRMTRTKVKAMDSRLMEMLFPANQDKNWSIDPTPRPDMALTPLAQMLIQRQQVRLQQAAQEQGGQPSGLTEEMISEIKKEAAKQACDAMIEEIDDQLKEGKHREICKRVVHSGNLYGVGVLKAPLTQTVTRNAWGMDEGSGGWTQNKEEVNSPYEEDVPVWDWYPDSHARTLDDCEVFHERHVMNRTDFLDLAGRENDGFDAELIRQYARDFRNGDCDLEHWERSVDELSGDNDTKRIRTTNRYEVVEIWTSLTSSELADMGIEDDVTEQLGRESVWCNIWMVGQLVIKVDIEPLPGLDHPYHLYYYEQDESSIWGEGLAAIMRDDQTSLNAILRASLDNAASSAGFISEVDVAALAPGESSDIYPGRKFMSRGTAKSTHGAVRITQIQSRVSEFLGLAKVIENNIHEDTLPSYMHGDSDKGVGRTVGGLSMLMGAANINVKDQVRNFDDGITKPVIEGFYNWNMVFGERADIKGDFTVKPKGSSSLVAKEVRAQSLAEMTDFVLHPEVKQYCDVRKFAEEMFKVRDLGNEDIVLSEEESGRNQQMEQQLQQLQQAVEQSNVTIHELQKAAPSLFREVVEKLEAEQKAQEVAA